MAGPYHGFIATSIGYAVYLKWIGMLSGKPEKSDITKMAAIPAQKQFQGRVNSSQCNFINSRFIVKDQKCTSLITSVPRCVKK